MPYLKLAPESCVFVGQTEVDRSLIVDGKFSQLADFRDELSELAEQYTSIYFKPHPYTEDKRVAARAVAILAIVGVVNVPIIHYSVEWWNSLHQGPTVTKFDKPSIHWSKIGRASCRERV